MIFTLFNPTVIAEWLALLAAIRYLRKSNDAWRMFIVVLSVIIIAETTGWICSYVLHRNNNGWIFNINLIVYTSFYIWLLSKAVPLLRLKAAMNTGIITFLLFFIINGFYFEGFKAFQTYTYIFGQIIILVSCLCFFYTLLSEDSYRNLLGYEYFWLSNALLLNALGSIVLFAFYRYITDYDNVAHTHIYGTINYVINVILYGSFIISFICRHKNQNY